MAKTNKPIIRIHDLATNEIVDREMNDSEFAQYQADQTDREAIKAQAEVKATAKAAILDRLGLTAEEAALLLS